MHALMFSAQSPGVGPLELLVAGAPLLPSATYMAPDGSEFVAGSSAA